MKNKCLSNGLYSLKYLPLVETPAKKITVPIDFCHGAGGDELLFDRILLNTSFFLAGAFNWRTLKT